MNVTPRHLPARPAQFATRPALALLAASVVACGEDGPPPPALLQPDAPLAQTGTVGAMVAEAPAVIVRDSAGNPLPGIRVDFSVVAGGGSLGATSATSDAMGQASAGSWTLGTQAGENAVEAIVGSLARPRFTAQAEAGAAATMEIIQGDDQVAVAGQPTPILPTVRVEDGYGNPAEGTVVRFDVIEGNAQVDGAVRVVDADGTAAPLAWNLGSIAGTNVLRATTEGVPDVRFDAIGERGAASQIVAFEGDDQVADTGSEVPLPPRVLVADDVGNGVPGATVIFAVESGGGSVTGDTVTTGLDGTASVGSWTLGGQLGVQTLVATTDSVPGDTARFDVTTTAAVSVLFIVAGESQDAEVNTTVDIAPTVRAEDEFGNPAAGAEVTFEVIQGGGSVPTNVVVTDAGGLATVPSWRVGADFAANVLRASGGDATPVEFTANGVASTSDYDIEIRYLGSVTLAQQQAFATARAKWRAAVTGDVPAVQLTSATCAGRATLNEIVDDVLILAEIGPIDGPGNVLGSAGPCFVRSSGLLPIAGIMSFDDADLASLEMSGLLDEVIVHEMGHVLGVGTVWSDLGLLTGAGTNDPIFTGAGAIQAFLDVGGDTYAGDPVPVANTGGPGTRDAHWRESVFDNELMTGFLDAGANPLSIVSIASLADLGYVVDLAAADAYSLPEPGMAAARETAGKFRLIEAPLPPPVVVP